MNRARSASRRTVTTPHHAPEHRVAFVQSAWHGEIVAQGRKAFAAAWKKAGRDAKSIDYFLVPGAFEIPLQVQLLAKTSRYSAIVAAGLVVDGGIYRHEFVADAVIKALMQVQLETEVPVLSCVLTPRQFHAHEEHEQFFRKHFLVKGREAAEACAATIEAIEKLKSGSG